MRVFEVGFATGRQETGARRLAVEADDSGLYRLRGAADAALHGPSAYRRRESAWAGIGRFLLAIGRLVLPVLLLVSAFAAMYLYLDTRLEPVVGAGLAPSWLTVSHLVLPASFFLVALTNRRYGPAYAFAQVVIGLAIAAAATLFESGTLAALVTVQAQPAVRDLLAFVIAFFAAAFISILVFDGARGPRWWVAPLLSLEAAAIVYALAFFPMAYAGVNGLWPNEMASYFGILAASGVALLIPYWMLRGLIPPLSGFGGY